MMFFKTTTLLGLAAVTLATPAACNSNTNNVALYKPPKFDIFAVIDLRVGWPNNVTTHDGPIAMAPIFGGQVKGKFNGQLHPNISAETERLLPGSDGSRSHVVSQWLFENDDDERIFASLEGLTTYANNALHGFGSVTMKTDNKKWDWVNWADFIVEWQGVFATGQAQFQISRIMSGGRRDGKPIPALEPTSG